MNQKPILQANELTPITIVVSIGIVTTGVCYLGTVFLKETKDKTNSININFGIFNLKVDSEPSAPVCS